MMLHVDRFCTELTALLDRFAELSGRPDGSISRACFGYANSFAKKVRDGDSFTMSKARQFESWLREGLTLADEDREAFVAWFNEAYDLAVRRDQSGEALPPTAE